LKIHRQILELLRGSPGGITETLLQGSLRDWTPRDITAALIVLAREGTIGWCRDCQNVKLARIAHVVPAIESRARPRRTVPRSHPCKRCGGREFYASGHCRVCVISDRKRRDQAKRAAQA
jgi:hypothetical protein